MNEKSVRVTGTAQCDPKNKEFSSDDEMHEPVKVCVGEMRSENSERLAFLHIHTTFPIRTQSGPSLGLVLNAPGYY